MEKKEEYIQYPLIGRVHKLQYLNLSMKHKVIFEAIVGSQSYGTSTPQSDVDEKFIFVQHPDEILSDLYCDQINETKDISGFEVGKFIKLLSKANPTMMEMLFSLDEFIIEKHPAFDIILKERDKFLTKQCLNSYLGYSIQQLKKASGLGKKMNWEKSRVTRKTPFDFCYVYENGKTIPLQVFLDKNNMVQENCGLIALQHFNDCYGLFYEIGTGYRGISIDNGNDIRLSTIPKGKDAVAIICYNKDAYTMHCSDYLDYTEWLENRNTQRYVDVAGHDYKIDGKNLMHCMRLLETSEDICKYGEIRVRRPNAEYLLSIRRGEVNLEELVKTAQAKMEEVKLLFEKSDLPDSVDEQFIHDLILRVRKSIDWNVK